MSFENPTVAVRSEETLSSEETLINSYDIPSDKCTCIEKATCNYCSIQKYKAAWSGLKDIFITDKNTFYSHDVMQEIPDSKSEEKCDADSQCNDELNLKPEDDHVDSDSNSRLSEKTLEEVYNTSSTEKTLEEVYNTSSTEKTKDEQICDHLEQSVESCDNKTIIYTDCPVKQELNEGTDTETYTDPIGLNSTRSRRNSKRKRDLEDSCPVCGLTVRYSELENHFAKEVENLSKILKNVKKPPLGDRGANLTFVQVKCNRENRLSAKVAKYGKKIVNPVYCPVCNVKLTGSEDDINEHVLNCSDEGFDSVVNIVDRDGSFEEYDFGDETRVRAISFVPGGYKALHGHSSKSKPTGDNDEVLNVDVDDTLTYGKPQYTELDVIHNLTDAAEVKQLEQLRKAVLTDPTVEPHVLESRKWSITSEKESEESENAGCSESTDESTVSNKNEHECAENKDNIGNEMQADIVSSLKEKIKSLEDQNKNVKCLICLEPYTKPVVSTTCWHVHCEECWLMTMGVKKLCPQCNLIVFPSDLRRIYL